MPFSRIVHFDFRFVKLNPKKDVGHVILQRGDSVSFSFPPGALMSNQNDANYMAICAEGSTDILQKDMWYRATMDRHKGFQWESKYLPSKPGKFAMKMVHPRNGLVGVIPFDFVEAGSVRSDYISKIYPLDGCYETSYPGSRSPEGRVIDVKNHMFTSEDGDFVYHIDLEGNKARYKWYSGTEQWTVWSGRYPPNDLDWSTNNTRYPHVNFKLKGQRRFAAAMYGGSGLFRNAMGGRGGGGVGGMARRGPVGMHGGRSGNGYHHGGYHNGGGADSHW